MVLFVRLLHIWALSNMYLCIQLNLHLFLSDYHYNDVIMSMMASQITSLTTVYSTFYSRRRSRKHQSSASLAFVWGIHHWPVNCPHKRPVMRKICPFDDVIMITWTEPLPGPTLMRKNCHSDSLFVITGIGICEIDSHQWPVATFLFEQMSREHILP